MIWFAAQWHTDRATTHSTTPMRPLCSCFAIRTTSRWRSATGSLTTEAVQTYRWLRSQPQKLPASQNTRPERTARAG